MHRAIFFLLLAAACLAAQGPDDAVKKELKLFQGKWEAISAQGFDGKAPTEVELQLTSLVIEGEKFTMKTGSLDVKATFSVDPSKKPKHIDVFFGDNKDNVMRGIYEIKGDTRKSCFAEPGKARPDKFRKDKGFMTLEWRQAK